jgi:hypothetical protein
MPNTTSVAADQQQAASAGQDRDVLSVLDVARGIALYLSLYLLQRAESLVNRLRGRPSSHYDNW